MTAFLLSLLCVWPTSPAPRADTYALITACDGHGAWHQWPVVVSRGTVIRVSPEIGHVNGWDWKGVKDQCKTLDWPILEVSILQRGKPPFRFRVR